MKTESGVSATLANLLDPYSKREGFLSVALSLAGFLSLTLVLLGYPVVGIAVIIVAGSGIVRQLVRRKEADADT